MYIRIIMQSGMRSALGSFTTPASIVVGGDAIVHGFLSHTSL